MKMLGVNPIYLCDKHLLAEHAEIHVFARTIRQKISVKQYTDSGCLDTTKIKSRHDDLAKELERRKIPHRTPLTYVDEIMQGSVNSAKNTAELMETCDDCYLLIRKQLEERIRIHD